MKKASIRSILHTRKPSKQQLQLDRIEEKIDALHALQAVKPQAISDHVSKDKYNIILRLLVEGRKIEAIKEYRAYFGVGLREAKDAIEGIGPVL